MNIEEGGVYLHKKKQDLYTVLHIGRDEATDNSVAIYQRTNVIDATIWVRPLNEFKERFERWKVNQDS